MGEEASNYPAKVDKLAYNVGVPVVPSHRPRRALMAAASEMFAQIKG